MTYKIAHIVVKAARTGWGQAYIDDCRALADKWDGDICELSPESVAEIKATWNQPAARPTPKASQPCNNCRGL